MNTIRPRSPLIQCLPFGQWVRNSRAGAPKTQASICAGSQNLACWVPNKKKEADATIRNPIILPSDPLHRRHDMRITETKANTKKRIKNGPVAPSKKVESNLPKKLSLQGNLM